MYQTKHQKKNMWQVCSLCVVLIEECGSCVSYTLVALKMAVGGHGSQVAVSLLNRLHGAKDWVVCVAFVSCDE